MINRFNEIETALGIPPKQSLTEKAMAGLRATFQENGHEPSTAQWHGLKSLVATLEEMANGKADPLYYLSPLDPGVGKSQSIVHFVRELLASEDHKDVAVLICLGRLAEIQPMIADMKLAKDDFAVLVQSADDATGERMALLAQLNSAGNPHHRKARVLFTTQQMLEIRTKGKAFVEADEFHFSGKPRQVRIWDEAMLPGRAITIDVSELHKLLEPANYIPKLRDGLKGLIDEIEGLDHDTGFVIPDMVELTGITDNEALGLFGVSKSLRDAAADLWLMSGKSVVVHRSGARNVFIHYEDTLPDDLKPVVVCDASGRVRQTYALWEKGRGDLVRLQDGGKNYENLTILLWRRGGGWSSWEKHADELIDGIITTVNEKVDDEFLIVYPMRAKEVPNSVRTGAANPDRLAFVHWGGSEFKATNDYRDYKNVILAGTLFYPQETYVANARMSKRLESSERVDQETFSRIREGEHADLILQALCRGAVRKSIGNSCGECSAYVIASTETGIPAMLSHKGDIDIFPGSKVVDWFPVETELSGKAKDAHDIIINTFDGETKGRLRATEVRDALAMDANNWNSRVIHDKDFQAALADQGIYLHIRKGRGGSYFSRDRN